MKTNKEYLDNMHFLDKNGIRLQKMEWMQWISIEEKLPPIGQFVIGSDGNNIGECIYLGRKLFEIFNHAKVRPWKQVIYWMPFPPLPISKK